MPPKRIRRSSPARYGLGAGERLKRTKLTNSKVYSAWGWVGTEVSDLSHISQQHCLATCGISDNSLYPLCPNRFSTAGRSSLSEEPSKVKVAAGELEDDIIVISDDESPICSSKTCKTNPYCLNHLGQEKWEDEAKAREAFLKGAGLGENPVTWSRKRGHPVGLRNLGATCYANAYLQVWFQDLPFRKGVYECQLPEDEQSKLDDSPIFQLQVTFAAMQEGAESSFNPVRLVESLKLRTTEQQDAQEFSKLFMAHLDTVFQKQADPGLKSLLANQFEGKQVYVTTCQECQYRSERSSDFLEIEVTLKSNSTLEERLAALLEPETMSGDNQYYCPRCNSLQDARRYTELRGLPPVLHFSLLRFVYDVSTMERKKSKHSISYPTVINMDKFLGSVDSRKAKRKDRRKEGNVYYLRGVLLHKGPSAYHGHYEAQVFDVQNQAWYQFNDETVTKIESLGGKVSGDSKNGSGTHSSKKRPRPNSDSDVEILEQPPPADTHEHSPERPVYISSKDTYMLVYSRARAPEAETLGDAGARPLISRSRKMAELAPRPPVRAIHAVDALRCAHEQDCNVYDEKKQRTLARFNELRQTIMTIYRSWNLTSRSEESVVASRQGLESWLTRHLDSTSGIESQPSASSQDVKPEESRTVSPGLDKRQVIDMSQVLCGHGRLDPDKATCLKLITRVAYLRIVGEDACEFRPVLSPADVCEDCVANIFQEKLYQIEHPRTVEQFDNAAGVSEDEAGFWISKHWLKDWRLTRPKMHVASKPDPPPDALEFKNHVTCEHGGLATNVTARRRVSSEACILLQQIFPTWQPVATDTELCPVCEALVHISKEDKREVRRQAEDEKARLKHMHDNALNGNTALLENVACVIIPAQFVRSWRQWLLRPAELSRPDRLDNSQFICEHGWLAIDPNAACDMDASVAIIKRTDWDILEELYSGGPLIAVENIGTAIQHDLPVCIECRLKRKSTFDVTEITVRIRNTKEALRAGDGQMGHTHAVVDKATKPPVLVTYGSRKAGGLRQSSRIRQIRDQGKRRNFTIASTMTIKDLKILFQEELDIPTISQRLFYHGEELDDSSATVSSVGILSNDLLDLQEQLEGATLLSDSDDTTQPRRTKRNEGHGFGGTVLGGAFAQEPTLELESRHSSVKTCPACTFENDTDAFACSICDTPIHSPS